MHLRLFSDFSHKEFVTYSQFVPKIFNKGLYATTPCWGFWRTRKTQAVRREAADGGPGQGAGGEELAQPAGADAEGSGKGGPLQEDRRPDGGDG
jgi:hypothetical protein